MSKWLFGSVLIAACVAQILGGGVFGTKPAAGGTPTLTQSLGKIGMDKGLAGSATGGNGIIFTLDPTGWPHGVSSGGMVIMSGLYPNNPTTANGYPQTCASPCAPTWTDNGSSNTWNKVFATASSCQDTVVDANGINHNIYYAFNFTPPTTPTATKITETHTNKITQTYFSPSSWYNIATTSPLDGSSCLTGVTPVNNTNFNITGTAITTTSDGDLIYVEVDDSSSIGEISTGGNKWNSVAVPSGCTLLQDEIYMGHLQFYCIQTSHGSFTPQATISQTTHDTFVIYAAAFKSGSGGSAPGTGKAVLLEAQTFVSTAATYTWNVPCPTTTTSIVVTDDAGFTSSITDSNSNTYTKDANGGGLQEYHTLNITISNPNTFTISAVVGAGGNAILSAFCLNTTTTDTYTAGTGNTQDAAYSVHATGSGTSFTSVPLATPTTAGDVIVLIGAAGTGPFLTCSQPTGCVMDYPNATVINACTVTGAGICGGDTNSYTNGDTGGHYWINSTAQQNFGWTINNGGTVMGAAFK